MKKKIYNVGNLVNIPNDSVISSHSTKDEIIFVGKMSYEPNVIAVNFFSTRIFPKLRMARPNLSFTIIGANPDPKVLKLEKIDGVKVTGFVDSIEPYFQNSTIVVAPMLTGAGIQNKIIQAMAYGCCVATTSIGAEGLDIQNREIAIYNGEEEWINGLLMLLEDSSLRRKMGTMARNYVKTHLSKEVIASQFWKFIDSAILNTSV